MAQRDRSVSHGNLSNYLTALGASAEASQQLLASIVYGLVTNHRQDLAIKLANLAIHTQRAAAAGGRYELPRLAELLARSEFAALRETLAVWGVTVADLQPRIDQLTDKVRQQVDSETSGQAKPEVG